MEYKIYRAEIDADINSDLEVNFIGLVDRPAIEKNFLAFKDQQPLKFIINEEKRIISGPAMIADLPLYRKDKDLGEYYVIFDKATIKTIMQKFAAKGYMQAINLFHDASQKVDDVTIFNSFQSDKELGILPPANFSDLPEGSWFVTMQINNDAVWQKVKAGEIKGFSVEGLFVYAPLAKVQMTKQERDEAVLNYLEKIDALLN